MLDARRGVVLLHDGMVGCLAYLAYLASCMAQGAGFKGYHYV